MVLPVHERLASIIWRLLPVRAGFAVRPLPAGSKRLEIALPATTSERTSPAGPGGLSSFGALGRVSRSGRFRNRASDPRPRTVRGSTLSRAEASGSGPAAACRSTDPGGAGFFVHRDRWLRGREDSVRPVLTGNSVKSFLKNILARRCSRTTARFRALPELCQRIRATSFSAKTSCYNLGAHRGAENHDVEFQVTGRASAECWLRIAKWPRHIPMLWAAPERSVPATGPSGCSELATSWRLFALWCGEAG